MNVIETYFNAERTTGMIFALTGLVAMVLALWGWRQGNFLRGAAWPLLIVALVQIGVGISVWLGSHNNIVQVQKIAETQPARVMREEVPRMHAVIKNFSRNLWLEIAALAIALLLTSLASRGHFWQGVGIGLAIQMSIIILLDLLAKQRGTIYLNWLTSTFSSSTGSN